MRTRAEEAKDVYFHGKRSESIDVEILGES